MENPPSVIDRLCPERVSDFVKTISHYFILFYSIREFQRFQTNYLIIIGNFHPHNNHVDEFGCHDSLLNSENFAQELFCSIDSILLSFLIFLETYESPNANYL